MSVTTEYLLFPTEKLGVWRCVGGGGQDEENIYTGWGYEQFECYWVYT